MTRLSPLFLGGGMSLALLICLSLLQLHQSPILDLPVHWLGLSALPVLIALIVGKYLTSFKGFGIEFVAAINENVSTLDLDTEIEAEKAEVMRKREVSELKIANRKGKRLLTFELGRSNFYTTLGISAYMRELRNLEYMVVLAPDHRFQTLVPVSAFQTEFGGSDFDRIEEFITALEAENHQGFLAAWPYGHNSTQITEGTSLANAYKELRTNDADAAAVVSKSGDLQGLVRTATLAARIADKALAAQSEAA